MVSGIFSFTYSATIWKTNLSPVNALNLNKTKILSSGKELNLYHTIPTLNNTLRKKALENTAGKGENAGNQYFLIFKQYFLLY